MAREKMDRILALIPPGMVKEIDAYQERHGLPTQAEAMRRLMRAALDADKPKKRSALAPDEAAALVVLEKLRKRIGAADASEAMEKLWRMLINWENEQDAPAPAPEQPSNPTVEPPTKPPTKRSGLLSRITVRKNT
jgi:hypothetical protein